MRIIIGLDGVPYRLLDDLTKRGIMPNTRTIIEKGMYRQMQSSIPEVSSVAWSSIITGKNPGEHRIFGFTEIPKGTYRLSFPNFNNLRAKPFWQKENNVMSIIINVPSTFPVKPLNGIHISGFVSLDLERSVYPSSIIPELNRMNYKLDVDSDKAHQSLDLFLNDLDKTLSARIETYRYLWNHFDWQTFMLVFTGTDRLMHFLWNAYEDENNKYHHDFLNHFRRIDEVIGEITENLTENDLFILLSDHGFELLEKDININFLLKEKGFLNLKRGSQQNYTDIDYSTKAFALDPARIYINLTNKYPKGSVSEKEYDLLIDELIKLFYSLETNSKKAIKKVYRKEEIYKGPYLTQAPDLVLIANQGFNLKANLKAQELYGKGIFTGKHTQHDAFLLVNNNLNKNIVPESPCVTDFCGIMDRSQLALS